MSELRKVTFYVDVPESYLSASPSSVPHLYAFTQPFDLNEGWKRYAFSVMVPLPHLPAQEIDGVLADASDAVEVEGMTGGDGRGEGL